MSLRRKHRPWGWGTRRRALRSSTMRAYFPGAAAGFDDPPGSDSAGSCPLDRGDPARMVGSVVAPPARTRQDQAAADDNADQPGRPGLLGHRLRPLDRTAFPSRSERSTCTGGRHPICCPSHRHRESQGFPAGGARDFAITARHPDDFILDLADLDPAIVTTVAKLQRSALKNPPPSAETFIDTLRRQGLPGVAGRLQSQIALI